MKYRLYVAIGFVIAIGIFFLFSYLYDQTPPVLESLSDVPDSYMKYFSAVTMRPTGTIRHRLYADYQEHYKYNDTTELLRPRIELFQEDNTPIVLTAERGSFSSDNRLVELSGNVNLIKKHAITGDLELEIITTDARVFMDRNYAETDKQATIITRYANFNVIGMKAYLQTNKLELIEHVLTTVKP